MSNPFRIFYLFKLGLLILLICVEPVNESHHIKHHMAMKLGKGFYLMIKKDIGNSHY